MLLMCVDMFGLSFLLFVTNVQVVVHWFFRLSCSEPLSLEIIRFAWVWLQHPFAWILINTKVQSWNISVVSSFLPLSWLCPLSCAVGCLSEGT